MSRPSTSEVIALGEYLKPDFNPASLTVAQLLGILAHHEVKYPTQYTKAKLVELFNAEIKPKTKKFARERIKRENSQASEDGITDGMTGRPLGEKQVRTLGLASRADGHCDHSLPGDQDAFRRHLCLRSPKTHSQLLRSVFGLDVRQLGRTHTHFTVRD